MDAQSLDTEVSSACPSDLTVRKHLMSQEMMDNGLTTDVDVVSGRRWHGNQGLHPC